MGELKLPIFKEAQIRGDADVAEAQKSDTLNGWPTCSTQIDQQLRDSMLDLTSSQALVRVSQQNVELATRALSDANDRFAAGVDDNLPVVQAQATLSQAQSQLIADTAQLQPGEAGAGPQPGHRGYAVHDIPARQEALLGGGNVSPAAPRDHNGCNIDDGDHGGACRPSAELPYQTGRDARHRSSPGNNTQHTFPTAEARDDLSDAASRRKLVAQLCEMKNAVTAERRGRRRLPGESARE